MGPFSWDPVSHLAASLHPFGPDSLQYLKGPLNALILFSAPLAPLWRTLLFAHCSHHSCYSSTHSIIFLPFKWLSCPEMIHHKAIHWVVRSQCNPENYPRELHEPLLSYVNSCGITWRYVYSWSFVSMPQINDVTLKRIISDWVDIQFQHHFNLTEAKFSGNTFSF